MKQNNKDSDWLPKGYLIYLIILVLVGIGSWTHYLTSNYKKTKPRQSKPTAKHGTSPTTRTLPIDEGSTFGARISAENFVRKMMKSPNKSIFPPTCNVKKRKTNNTIEYIVESYVEAGSTANKQLKQHFICELRYLGNYKYELIDMKFY